MVKWLDILIVLLSAGAFFFGLAGTLAILSGGTAEPEPFLYLLVGLIGFRCTGVKLLK